MATLLDKFNEGKPKADKPEMTDAEKIKKLRADVKKLRAEKDALAAELSRAEKLMGSVRVQ